MYIKKRFERDIVHPLFFMKMNKLRELYSKIICIINMIYDL